MGLGEDTARSGLILACDLFTQGARLRPAAHVFADAGRRTEVVDWLRKHGFVEHTRKRRAVVIASEVSGCEHACRMQVRPFAGDIWATCPDGACEMVPLEPAQYAQYRLVPERLYEVIASANRLMDLTLDPGPWRGSEVAPIGAFHDGGVRVALVWLAPSGRPGARDAGALLKAVDDALGARRGEFDAAVGLSSPRHRIEPTQPARRTLAVIDAATVLDPVDFRLDRRYLHWIARGARDKAAWFDDHRGIELRFWLEGGFVRASWSDQPAAAPDLIEHAEAHVIYLLYLAAIRRSDPFGWVSQQKLGWLSRGKQLKGLRRFVDDLEGVRVGGDGIERIPAARLLPTAAVGSSGGHSVRLALDPRFMHFDLGDENPRLATRIRANRPANTSGRRTRHAAGAARAEVLAELFADARERVRLAPPLSVRVSAGVARS